MILLPVTRPIYAALDPVDFRRYAELFVMQSRGGSMVAVVAESPLVERGTKCAEQLGLEDRALSIGEQSALLVQPPRGPDCIDRRGLPRLLIDLHELQPVLHSEGRAQARSYVALELIEPILEASFNRSPVAAALRTRRGTAARGWRGRAWERAQE